MHDKAFSARLVRSPSGCLLWTGYRDRKGYGRLTRLAVSPSPLLAHRYAWFLAYGTLPALPLMHSCDTPACCEVAHLAEGTAAENNADMWGKGRGSLPPNRAWCTRHPRVPENMVPNGSGWTCRACKRERDRRYDGTRRRRRATG